jgi:hypothetical protein
MTTYHSGSCKSGTGVTVLALILISAGVLLLLDNFGILWIDRVWDLWPLTLIAVGVAELIRWRRQKQS